MTTVTATGSARPMRKDVARNRALLLAAAEELVAARGIDTTLDEVARHAGLGVGTAYRHFANKRALITALFEHRMQQVHDRAVEAERNPDAGAGLVAFLTEIGEMQASDRGIREVIASDHGEKMLADGRDRLLPIIEGLVARAQADGQIRPEMAATDVAMIVTILGSLNEYAGEHAHELWRRYLDVLLDGFAGPAATPRALSTPAPDRDVVEKIMSKAPRVGGTRAGSAPEGG